MGKLNKKVKHKIKMDFKIGVLAMVVGIVIVGMVVGSVAGYNTCAYCKISAGSGYDENIKFGSGDQTAHCYLSNLCGFYDGYVDGNTGNGVFWSNSNMDCYNADGESLQATSYYSYSITIKGCYHY